MGSGAFGGASGGGSAVLADDVLARWRLKLITDGEPRRCRFRCGFHSTRPDALRAHEKDCDPGRTCQERTSASFSKDDFLHLHADLFRVAEALVARGAVDAAALDGYTSFGVKPGNLYARRRQHFDALALLAAELRRALERRP